MRVSIQPCRHCRGLALHVDGELPGGHTHPGADGRTCSPSRRRSMERASNEPRTEPERNTNGTGTTPERDRTEERRNHDAPAAAIGTPFVVHLERRATPGTILRTALGLYFRVTRCEVAAPPRAGLWRVACEAIAPTSEPARVLPWRVRPTVDRSTWNDRP